jgi:hypothetical protein
MEIDSSEVGKDTFAVAIEPLQRDPSKVVLSVRVVKPPSTKPGAMGLTGATIEYALNDSTSFERIGPLTGDRGESSPYKLQEELRRARSVTIRIRGIMGQQLGPFTYQVDGRAAGIASTTQEHGERPLQEFASITNEQMKVRVKDLLPVARCIWLGSNPERLTLRIPIAGLEQELAEAEKRNRHWRDSIAHIPTLPNKPTYACLEWLDGTKTPVETFLPPERKGPYPGRTGLAITPAESGGPELFLLLEHGSRAAGAAGEYIPALWIGAENVRYSFDDGGGIPAKRINHPYGVGHYFSILEPLVSGPLRLEVDWTDDRPTTTYHYTLPDPGTVLIENAVMCFASREKDLAAIRFNPSTTPAEDEREVARQRSDLASDLRSTGINIPLPEEPLLRLGIWTRTSDGAPHEESWLAVEELRYGFAPGKLTERLPGPITPEDLLQKKKLEDETFFRVDLPFETPGLYYKFRLRDGSETKEVRLRIEEQELPAAGPG